MEPGLYDVSIKTAQENHPLGVLLSIAMKRERPNHQRRAGGYGPVSSPGDGPFFRGLGQLLAEGRPDLGGGGHLLVHGIKQFLTHRNTLLSVVPGVVPVPGSAASGRPRGVSPEFWRSPGWTAPGSKTDKWAGGSPRPAPAGPPTPDFPRAPGTGPGRPPAPTGERSFASSWKRSPAVTG